jgi:hypothetical protein
MDEFKDLFKRMNKYGIYLPLVCDPKTGRGSVSLTLVFLSSIWVQLSLVGKVVTAFGGLDTESAIYWFLSCSALYFGRKLSGSKGAAELSKLDSEGEPLMKSEPKPKVDNPD